MALIETIPVKEDYRRKIAQQLMREGMSSEPVLHWAQGLGRLGQAALGGYQMYQADQRDKETESGNNAALIAALGGGGMPAQPSPQQPTAQPMPPVSSVTPSAGAVPAALSGARPGGSVMPSNKVWGDKEAEAAGLYEPSTPTKTAALSPMVPTPVKTEAIQPQAAPAVPSPTDTQMADARKAMAIKMLASDNPQMRKVGAGIAQALIGEQIKPNEYDFKVVGENLVKTDKKGNASVVPGMSASKPQWTDTGEKDQNGNPVMGWVNPGDKSVTPYRPQGSTTPATITGPDGKPITVQPGQDPKIIREAASKRAAEEAMPASGDSVSKLRNEVQGLPSYKNIAQAAPVYKSMLEAAGRDTRAADVNMIYGMAKIMDPGSVVRESEMTVAQAIATLPQQLQATVQSQLQSSGRLTPEVREAIMQEAHSRIGAYQSMFDQDVSMYRGIAQRGRMNEADVLPSFGPYEQYKRATKGGNKTKSGVSWSVEP
jgi:hypothetical protein